jgi:NADH:ubiquinone oxidoreductase subunit K
MPLQQLYILSAFLFSLGLVIVLIKRNAIMVLMGIELMLNAANINLIAFNQKNISAYDGQVFALFVMVIAVCETAVGLAIILQVYRHFHSSIPDEINELKG